MVSQLIPQRQEVAEKCNSMAGRIFDLGDHRFLCRMRPSYLAYISRCSSVCSERARARHMESMGSSSLVLCMEQAPHQLRIHAVRTEVPTIVPLYLHHKATRCVWYVPAV